MATLSSTRAGSLGSRVASGAVTATLWIALIGAADLGGVVTALVTHWLNRKPRNVDLAEKTVRVADAMITRLQADLDCALAALERTKQESAFHASPAYASGVRISLRSLQDLSPRLLRHYRRTPGGTNVSAS